MKMRNFTDLITGDHSSFPWSRDDALKTGYTKWTDRNGCERCGNNGPKVRYLKDNSCVGCLMKSVGDAWLPWCQGDPGRPNPWSTSPDRSAALGIDWYYETLCTNGPHLRRTSIRTGRCFECESDARHFKSLRKGPRATARAAGERYYTPVDACPSCGKVAPRNVVTNGCTGCSKRSAPPAPIRQGGDGRRTPSRQFAAENPNFVIGRDAARTMGFTLYRTGEPCRRGHTGWRYVSTGNCLDCLNR